jgi:LysR family transcriptional regulator, low CO2-responsive transcriptional regulator
MNFTLSQLNIFLKVTQTQSITKASEELHLTQPAVSIQLKNFQQQFDIPLTEVINQRIFITDFGKEIALAAEKILEEVYAINYKTSAFKGQLAGKLKIELLLDVTNKAKVIESLEKNEVDFSLVSVIPENLSLNNLELIQNKLFLVGNMEEKYRKKSYDNSIFEKIPLIYREQGSGTRYVMEKFIKANNLPVKKKMELTSNEAVKQAVVAGLGYSIMPLIGIKNELNNHELQIIPVKGFPIKSVWNLIWLQNKNLSPVASAFLEYLKQEKGNIIQQHFHWYEAY